MIASAEGTYTKAWAEFAKDPLQGWGHPRVDGNPGEDVVIWNNRATLHYATNDYDGERRLLLRTTFRRCAPR